MRNEKVTKMVCLVVLLTALPAMATEYSPSWFGQAGTTYQKWTFDTNANPVAADVSVNPYALTPSQATVEPAPGKDWESSYAGRSGVWPLSGVFNCNVANIHVMDKEIIIGGRWRLDLPIYDPDPGAPWMPHPTIDIKIGDGVYQNYTPVQLQNEHVGNGWRDVAFQVSISSAVPFDSETIRVGGDFYIDTLRIDTLAIPEPATLSLIALGMIGAIRRRRGA